MKAYLYIHLQNSKHWYWYNTQVNKREYIANNRGWYMQDLNIKSRMLTTSENTMEDSINRVGKIGYMGKKSC